MIVLVCGGRYFRDRDLAFYALDRVEAERGPIIGLVHGYASGADTLADFWMCYTIAYEELAGKCARWISRQPADWQHYGRSAGPIRNRRMLDVHPGIELVLALPGGHGTDDMIACARNKGLPVWQPKGVDNVEEASGFQSSAE